MALVSSKTAYSSIHALQTTDITYGDMLLPFDNDHLQFDDNPSNIIGLFRYIYRDSRFDETDPFRYEVDQFQIRPGGDLIKDLGLVQQAGKAGDWIKKETGELILTHQAWCDEPATDDSYYQYYKQNTRSDGWRLWARIETVRSYIKDGGWDLVYEVKIRRRLYKGRRRTLNDDVKSKVHRKYFVFRSDGSIVDISGPIGTWAKAGRQ